MFVQTLVSIIQELSVPLVFHIVDFLVNNHPGLLVTRDAWSLVLI